MSILGKKERERMINKIEWARYKKDSIIEDTTNRYCVKIRKSFNEIKTRIVRQWYQDYGLSLRRLPGGYIRKLDLFKISKIDIDKDRGIVAVIFDENNMTHWHRVNNEYIYQNSFVEGWHGGARKVGDNPKPGYEQKHPEPGIPYWRYPTPWNTQDGEKPYVHWYGKPAERTLFGEGGKELGPRDEILRQFKIEVNKLVKKLEEEQTEKVSKVFDQLEDYIIKHRDEL